MKTITYLCALAFIIILCVDLCNPDPAPQQTTFTVRKPEVKLPEMTATQKKGETLFMANCAACHNKNMKDPMTGPPLYGARQRWIDNGDYDDKTGLEWLYEWIRNSQGVIKAGHPYGNVLYNEWNNSVMTPMPFTNEEIDAVFEYVEYQGSPTP